MMILSTQEPGLNTLIPTSESIPANAIPMKNDQRQTWADGAAHSCFVLLPALALRHSRSAIRYSLFAVCYWPLVLLLTSLGLASDKSGVSANAISLPKGPGSIEGLGESFQFNFGHEKWWPFGVTGLFDGGPGWLNILSEAPQLDAKYAWTILDPEFKKLTGKL